MLVDYDQLTGNVSPPQFRGLPEGQVFQMGLNQYQIRYSDADYGTSHGGNSSVITLTVVPSTYAPWIASFPAVGTDTGIDKDPDGDRIPNGLENYFGTDPSKFSIGLLAVAAGGGNFTFRHPMNPNPAGDLTVSYRWSKNLVDFYGDGASDGINSVSFSPQPGTPAAGTTTVIAAITGPFPDKLFVVAEVTR